MNSWGKHDRQLVQLIKDFLNQEEAHEVLELEKGRDIVVIEGKGRSRGRIMATANRVSSHYHYG